MENKSGYQNIESRINRRGFLAAGLTGLAGLVLGSDVYASEKGKDDKKAPERIPYKKDPFISLREKYAYKDLKKALGEVYDTMDERDKKDLEERWEEEVFGARGVIYEYYLRGIYENPEKFKKFIPEKKKRDFQKFSFEKLDEIERAEIKSRYPWFNDEDFKPNKKPDKTKEVNRVLIYVEKTLLSLYPTGDFPPYIFKYRSVEK